MDNLTSRPGRRRLALAIAVAAFTAPVSAHAATLSAPTATAFDAAVSAARAGDVIQLSPVAYPDLLIRRHVYSSPVTIVGAPGTRLADLTIKDSSNVTVRNLAITPPADERSTIAITSSSFVTIDHVVFDGRDEAVGAGLNMSDDSTDVVIQNSEFTNCGGGTRCFAPAGTRVSVLNNNFHDCYDCDFVRGGGSYVTISGNTFDRAQPGSCTGGTTVCPHDDLMQIMGGAHYSIAGNHFGARSAGAAQLFIASGLSSTKGPDDVYVANNTFDGGKMGYAIRVVGTPLPTNVRIVNNTVLTGDISSVRVDDGYAAVDPSLRPVLANNIFKRMTAVNCGLATFSSNLMTDGATCAANDQLGDPQLTGTGLPTAGSSLVLGLADPTLAPATDMLGTPRTALPDRGALQYAG